MRAPHNHGLPALSPFLSITGHLSCGVHEMVSSYSSSLVHSALIHHKKTFSSVGDQLQLVERREEVSSLLAVSEEIKTEAKKKAVNE